MRRLAVLLLACLMICGYAAAEQKVALPGERLSLTLPDEMTFSAEGRSDLEEFQFAYFTKILEMDVFAYPDGGKSLTEMRDMLRGDGVQAEIRKYGGLQVLCYSMTDESGNPCAMYALEDEDQVIEIAFWYAEEKAAKQADKIMGTIE